MKIDSSFLFDFARDTYSNFSYWRNDGKILMPIRYILEITYRCNLQCPFCYLGKERQLDEINENEWKNIIDQIPFYAFVSFLGGEIFIRNDFLNIFRYAAEKLSGKVNLYTNATMITDGMIDELLKNKFLLFSASLDGIGSNHDKLRKREGAFDRTYNTMLQVKNKKKNRKYPLLEIKTVVLNENLDDLPKLYKLCIENDFDFITYSFIRTTSIRSNPILHDDFEEQIFHKEYPIKAYFNIEHFQEIYKELESMSKGAKTLLRWAPKFKPTGDFEKIKSIFSSGNTDISELYKPCKFPFHDVFINPAGDVYPCLPVKMGSLKEQSLNEILNNKKFQDFRKRLKKDKVFKPCNLCCDLYPKMF